MSALEVAGISHEFSGRPALQNVSFRSPEGSFTVLLGPNGAGKTTLISLITRLYHAQVGAIRVFDHSLRGSARAALASIGVVFQQLTLDLDLTVRDNLRYHGSLHGLTRAEIEERQASELARLQVLDRIDEPVRTLSGGLRRRVEIARALLHRPRLLLLDEATIGLDPSARLSLLRHVRALCRDQNIAVLWATHLLDEVDDDDAIILLHSGSIRFSGSARELRESAASLAEAYFAMTDG
jgi:ABC-2 type transport system ATP-binding protein